MEFNRTLLGFVRFLFIPAILTLVIIYNESVENVYKTQVPKIAVIVNYLLDLLYQYQDDISRFIFRSILPGAYYSEADHTNLIRSVRIICMRLFLHLQITKWLNVAFGTARRFWSSTLRRRPPLMIRNQASTKISNPPTRVRDNPNCNCRLYPKEFHWLLFYNCVEKNRQENREHNEIHQSIMKLFDTPTDEPIYQIDFKTFDALQESLREQALANDEYTGWSKEILGRISAMVDLKNKEVHTGAQASTHHRDDSKQSIQNVDSEHCSPDTLPDPRSKNELSNSKVPSFSESSEKKEDQSSEVFFDVAFHPVVVIFEMADAANPVDARPDEVSPEEIQLEEVAPNLAPEEPRDAQLLHEPTPADDGPDHRKVMMMSLVQTPRSASTPLLCSLCPRPVRRFALTSVAEMMPVCVKLLSPYERCPRTTYTLVNVTP